MPTGMLVAIHHPNAWLSGRQRSQPRDRLGAVTRDDGGELGVPGPVPAALAAPLLTAVCGVMVTPWGVRTLPHGPSMCVASLGAVGLALLG